MVWMKDGNLACDTCPNILEFPGPRVMVIAAARAHDWHVFEGASIGGQPMNSYICRECMGTNRSKLAPAPRPMAEDQTLFEVES